MTVETKLEHHTEHCDGNSLSSWWKKSSIFGSHACEDVGVSPHGSNAVMGGGLVPIGGAKAQSRFCGKTAVPMFREEAKCSVEAVSHPKKLQKKGVLMERNVGYRCDGNPVVSTGDAFKDEWVFSFDEWVWKRADGVSISLGDCDSMCPDIEMAVRERDSLLSEASPEQERLMAKQSRVNKDQEPRGFAGVGGFHDIKTKLRENIGIPLKHAKACKRIGVPPGRGVLVHGQSGCGKTHLLSRLGEEYGVHMEMISCLECIGNEGAEKKIERAFQNAQNASPSILFFDNFEVLTPQAGDQASMNGLDQINIFTKNLDRLRNEKRDVAVICATNEIDSVHSSLRRHGRLDIEIFMGKPLSHDDKVDMLQCCLSCTRCASDLDVESLGVVENMQGFLASDIDGLVREAGFHAVVEAIDASGGDEELLCSPENIPVITKDHVLTALETIRVPGAMRMYTSYTKDQTSWESIGGLDDVKNQLIEMIEWPVMYGDIIDAYGLPSSSGALLYGAPGCGKTLLAKAVATSCKANFICINGPEILQKWLGETENTIRDIFRTARLSKPCVVFMDELDALAPRRKGASTGMATIGGDVISRVVAQILCEIDGVGSRDGNNKGVFVIGATNRPDAIDPALLRPGRLGEMIHVPLPDHKGRVSILDSNLRKCPKADGFNMESFASRHAELLEGLSGADLAELSRRAAMPLIRNHVHGVPEAELFLTEDDVYNALMGMRKSVSEETVAYYEGLVNALSSGKGFEGTQKQDASIPINLAIQLTEQVVDSKCTALKDRILELEELLQQHGIDHESCKKGGNEVDI